MQKMIFWNGNLHFKSIFSECLSTLISTTFILYRVEVCPNTLLFQSVPVFCIILHQQMQHIEKHWHKVKYFQ